MYSFTTFCMRNKYPINFRHTILRPKKTAKSTEIIKYKDGPLIENVKGILLKMIYKNSPIVKENIR